MLGHAKGPSGKPSVSSDAEESFQATIWVEKGLHVAFSAHYLLLKRTKIDLPLTL